MRFEVKQTSYDHEDFYIRLSCQMDNTNPLEVEKDLNLMKEFLITKYIKKTEKLSWREWIKNLFKTKN